MPLKFFSAKLTLTMIGLMASFSVLALPFTITPQGALPTAIHTGETLNAVYTVKNNTISQRINNHIEYLPPNVTVAQSGCSSQFTLNASGEAGDSCQLTLRITGPVNGADPDPKHHLFVCFPGNKICAGTNYPLNVSGVETPPNPNPPTPPPPPPPVVLVSIEITTATPQINYQQQAQFEAIGHYSDNHTMTLTSQVAWSSSITTSFTIDQTGLATNLAAGATQISAMYQGFTSNSVILSASITDYFFFNANPEDSGYVAHYCSLTNLYTIDNCIDTSNIPVEAFYSIGANSLTLYAADNVLNSVESYTADPNLTPINSYPVNETIYAVAENPLDTALFGVTSNATLKLIRDQTGQPSTLEYPVIGALETATLAFHPTGKWFYIGGIAISGGAFLDICTLDANDIPTCATSTISQDYAGILGVSVDKLGLNMYLYTYGNTQRCPIDPTTGDVTACVDMGIPGLLGNINFSSDGLRAYYIQEMTQTGCDINFTTGEFANCQTVSEPNLDTMGGDVFS